MFVCPKCKTSSSLYIGFINGKAYCRRCIAFKGDLVLKEDVTSMPVLSLDFSLSKKQREISNALALERKNMHNVFLYAVTGAGKTELVYKAMLEALLENKKVGFVVPRKDVVIDLYPRIESAFYKSKVIAIYGGHNKELSGDITLLTTHQLYRFKKYFDYLVFDEIDAFPYNGNELLDVFFKESLTDNGLYVKMSATPIQEKIDEVIKDNGIYLSLTRRYHNVDLPLPIIKLSSLSLLPFIVKKLKQYKNENKQCFIFSPTIYEAEKLFFYLKRIVPNGELVHSKIAKREQIIQDFKNKKYSFLITTSILERGVTVKNLQVLIYHADHELYDDASLIQISGRVGRKIDAPTGEVYFLAYKKTKAMLLAIKKIKEANEK